jgi:hypothetical protein
VVAKPVILVSGLPRSGTSMIMQMLEAGGVEILCDGERAADDDNPKGYYELEAVKGTKDDPSWLDGARGKAVKLISQLLYDLPEGTPCKVIFLRREMGEILASQRKMLERRGGGGAEGDGDSDVEDAEMSRIFETHLTEVLSWAKQRSGLELLEVWHAEVLRDSARVAAEIERFLGLVLDVSAMGATVDGGLHRNRAAGVTAEDYMDADEEEAVAKRLRDLGYL